ncbi:MAG: hypothetical protein LZF63_06775 [Nitrosomonas sp.]|nr:hypothetical protein [Nitrosomonas sp.]
MKGDYYTLAEAAEFIASKIGKKKNIRDVLLDAKKGKIRLCMWFDGTLYKFNRDKGTGKLQSIDDYKFSGYIQIPKKRITPEGGTVQFGSITIIEGEGEWMWTKNSDPRTLDDNELSDRYFDSQSNSYEPHNLFADLEKALIPEQDLLNFIEENQAADTKNNHHIQELSDEINRKKPITQQEIPPGKLPNTAIGKLVVKLAWEFECKYYRKATANEVIRELQNRVSEEDILLEAIPHGVRWTTTKLMEKDYSVDACGKTLGSWNKSRA